MEAKELKKVRVICAVTPEEIEEKIEELFNEGYYLPNNVGISSNEHGLYFIATMFRSN